MPRHPLARIALVLGLASFVVVGLGAGLLSVLEQGANQGLFTRLEPLPVAGAVALWLVASVLAGPRFAGLLPPGDRAHAPSGWRLGAWMLAVHALNLALPGPAGDAAFIGAVARPGGPPLRAVVAAMTFSRVGGLATTAGLGLLILPLAPRETTLSWVILVGAGAAALGGALLGAFSLRPALLEALAARTVGRLAGDQGIGRAFSAIERGVVGLARGLAEVAEGGLRALGRTILWSTAIQTCLLGALALACAAVRVDAGGTGLAAAHLTGELASVAVAIAPAGIGGFDAALVASLIAFCEVEPGPAGLVAIAVRLIQIVALAIGTAGVALLAPGVLLAVSPHDHGGKNVP